MNKNNNNNIISDDFIKNLKTVKLIAERANRKNNKGIDNERLLKVLRLGLEIITSDIKVHAKKVDELIKEYEYKEEGE